MIKIKAQLEKQLRKMEEMILEKANLEKVVIYCRDANSSENLKKQAEVMKSFVKSNPKYQLCGMYLELGAGTNVKKLKELQCLIKDCRRGKIEAILVKDLSRLSRNFEELNTVMNEFQNIGVRVETFC